MFFTLLNEYPAAEVLYYILFIAKWGLFVEGVSLIIMSFSKTNIYHRHNALLLFLSQKNIYLWVDPGDRQIRVYGTRDNGTTNGTNSPQRQQQQHAAASTSETASATRGGESTTSAASTTSSQPSAGGTDRYDSTGVNTPNMPNTPMSTPARGGVESEDQGDDGVLLCPRGLAAIPLLCAAASESRSAYLARLQVTHPSNGVSPIPCNMNVIMY